MNESIFNGIPPILPGLFRFNRNKNNSPELLGGFCPQCEKHFYPRPSRCHYCLEPLEEIGLGDTGKIYSFTIIRKKAPFGLPEPYGAGFVDLYAANLRIFCLFDPAKLDSLKIGNDVKLAVAILGHDGFGTPCLRPYFIPLFPNESLKAGGK